MHDDDRPSPPDRPPRLEFRGRLMRGPFGVAGPLAGRLTIGYDVISISAGGSGTMAERRSMLRIDVDQPNVQIRVVLRGGSTSPWFVAGSHFGQVIEAVHTYGWSKYC